MAQANASEKRGDAARKASARGEKRETLDARRSRFVTWFFSQTPAADAACVAVVVACVAILAWFFFVSPFGVPATPVYAGF